MGSIMALAMLALPAAAAPTTEAGGKPMGWSENLKAESRDGKVLVTLTVDNPSPNAVYVPKSVYEDNELFGRTFSIKTSDGTEIDYIGPMVKRGPFTAADFVKVAPASKRSHTIDITRSYDFKPGTHTYVISYVGKILPDLKNLDAMPAVPIPSVTLTHTAR